MYGNTPGPDEKGGMHPQDLKNLVMFFIIAALIYFSYDAFIARPQMQAQRAQREAQQAEQIKLDTHAKLAPRTRTEILADVERVKISNDKVSGSISTLGARIDDIALKDYYTTIQKTENVVVLSPNHTDFPRHVSHGWVAEEKIPLPDDDTQWQVSGNATLTKDTPVTLVWDNGAGLRFENIYSIDENYVITLKQSVTNNSGAALTLHPYGLISQTGLAPGFIPNWIAHEGPVGYAGEELHQVSYKAVLKEGRAEFNGNVGWAGITDKYWLTALMPPQNQEVHYNYRYTGVQPGRGQKLTGKFQVDYTAAAIKLESGQTASLENHVFVGAKKVLMLEEYSRKLNVPKFDLAVDFGWFWFMTKPFFFGLHYLGIYFGVALAMVLLTMSIRMAVFPLTAISYRSFAKMKIVSPQIAELRKIHGGDKQKLQEALVELYQREGVNPMSGCLPIVVQIPIFFSLYKVLVTTIEMRHAPFYGWIKDMSAPDPTSLFNLFGLIPWDPPTFLHIGVWPCLMLGAFLIQKKLNPPPQDQLQRDMALYFPFIMTYLMSQFASGLVIYWTLSAYLGVAQQIYIMKSLGVPIYLFGEYEKEQEVKDQVEKGPDVHPLIGLAEKEAEEALFGDDDGGNKPATSVSMPKRRPKKKR